MVAGSLTGSISVEDTAVGENAIVQPNRGQGSIFLERRRLLGAIGLAGLGVISGSLVEDTAPRASANQDKKPRPKVDVSPPPDDVNDLSMEVAALRTMYLLKASPDQAPDLPYDGGDEAAPTG